MSKLPCFLSNVAIMKVYIEMKPLSACISKWLEWAELLVNKDGHAPFIILSHWDLRVVCSAASSSLWCLAQTAFTMFIRKHFHKSVFWSYKMSQMFNTPLPSTVQQSRWHIKKHTHWGRDKEGALWARRRKSLWSI